MPQILTTFLLVLATLEPTGAHAAPPSPPATPWKPVAGRIMTRWAKDVNPAAPWPEYPRPTMERERWQNLNGLWKYSVTGLDPASTDKIDGEILVPFPIESALSGVARRIGPQNVLHYVRGFDVPADWRTGGQRVRLHFGAVDWRCRVSVNGKSQGEHAGGYDPFSFDITDALRAEGPNELIVMVMDPTNTGGQPRGKQWDEPHGIWYTPTTGIWQTVWLEPVPGVRIERLRTVANASAGSVEVTAELVGDAEGVEIAAEASGQCGGSGKASAVGRAVTVPISKVCEWSPSSPWLYELKVELRRKGAVVDRVKSYFAFRDVRVGKDASGVNRLLLNGKPVFMFGPLDQGFWPDGLYTPPTEEAMKFDIEAVKRVGGNMLRKHVKVENERFYYWCDRLGVLVWQDMPSPFFKSKDFDERSPELSDEWKTNFEREWEAIMQARGAHPSIVMWVPFNEGWGQNDLAWATSVVERTRQRDPSRLVNNASGWTDMHTGDVNDIHVYPGPGAPANEPARAAVLGEFGGLGLPVDGHTWLAKNNWGYVSYKSKEELTDAYVGLLRQLPQLIGDGLCAAVYTQTTDVEIEVNGWLTYDREVWKIDPERASAAAKALHEPPPIVRVLVPRAGQDGAREGEPWRSTTDRPGEDWSRPGFDASAWQTGWGGFGTKGTPGAIVGTEWSGSDIWLRRTVELPASGRGQLALSVHHDEDAEVYINGELAASFKGYTSGYRTEPLSPAVSTLLRPGKNLIAVHCRQTSGGQYIDVGIVRIEPRPEK
ncbi:MAG: hypothetical protein JNM07_04675 [Phycisphaerae bacterium]|nr:hypothetical protein [Phycisphaerae bacterium]